jgi:hypothetical protein
MEYCRGEAFATMNYYIISVYEANASPLMIRNSNL